MKKQQIKSVTKGVGIAIAAGLLAACQSTSTATEKQASTATAQQASTDLVHCYGVNACKGHNDCKTASNACAGHASCKGHGFVAMPSKACGDVGGETQDSWKGSIAKADLIHCNGVNVCKGHNDCKTASNACAGHASCKGHGFVSMPAKACKDIGGKEG